MRLLSIRRPAVFGLVLAAFSLLVSCDDPGSPKINGPGAIQVQLASPNGVEGSAVFEIQGGKGLGVVSAFGGEVYFEHNQGRETSRVVVVMDQPGEIAFTVRTSNLRNEPTVDILQVADGSNVLRPSLSGYEVEITLLPDGGTP